MQHDAQAEAWALRELARALARVSHAGQTRKDGSPAYAHAVRVENGVQERGVRARTIALLHDVVEDSAVTGVTLGFMGFPRDIVFDVITLTRQPGETYREFIDRMCRIGSEDALHVKLADLEDNLSHPYPGEGTLPNRYRNAYAAVSLALKMRHSDAVFAEETAAAEPQ